MNPFERLCLNIRSKFLHKELSNLERKSSQIGFVNPDAVDQLMKLPYLQQFEQELSDAYISGDPERMRIADEKRVKLSDVELFALARMQNLRLEELEKNLKNNKK